MNSVFTLEELFSGKVLIVPDTAGYAWEVKQWNDFLDDLEYLGDDKHHYTGTVVLDPQTQVVRDEEGRGNKVFHIVDGQQRLTTIVVLLKTIRARVAKFNSTLATGIRKSYIEFRDLNQQRSYKLRLNGDSQDYFAGSILTAPSGPEGPLIASHKRLKDAKAHFSKYLDGKEEAEGTNFRKWVVRFYEKVIQQLRVSQYIRRAVVRGRCDLRGDEQSWKAAVRTGQSEELLDVPRIQARGR